MKGFEILLEHLEPLRKYLEKGSINEDHIDSIRKALDAIPFFTSFTFRSHFETIQRVTINKRLPTNNNERITQLDHLKYPPAQAVARYGRLNGPRQSLLYATFEPLTALAEMRPEVGDRISISTWTAAPGADLTVSPVFKNTSADGEVHNLISLETGILYRKALRGYDEQIGRQLDILIQFMADFFSKNVDDSNSLDYYVSAYYANKILFDFENGAVDAILYPSVRQKLTMSNIAIKPEVFDRLYSLTKVEESIVTQIPAQNRGWAMEGTGNAKIGEDQSLQW